MLPMLPCRSVHEVLDGADAHVVRGLGDECLDHAGLRRVTSCGSASMATTFILPVLWAAWIAEPTPWPVKESTP